MPNKIFGGFHFLGILLACATVLGLTSCASPRPADGTVKEESRQRILLDADWRFHRGDFSSSNEIIFATYDDKAWQAVHLPHDYVLDGTYNYSEDRKVGGHGYLQYDVAWYRKHFSIPESSSGQILRLDFDGVFRASEVWLNGHYLGSHLSGYTPFSFDITKVANVGGGNILTVRVDPREWEGWWYEGGGIYRHVWLTTLAPTHVAQWGTYVTSKVPNGDQGADGEGDVTIQTTLENNDPATANCTVVSEIVGPDEKSLQTLKMDQSVAGNGQATLTQQTVLPHPKLWSVGTHNLYELRTTVLQDGKPVDSTTTTFGIRTIRYDANKGFFLNGRHVEIQGVANHQDFSALGIAVPDNLQSWRVAKLKEAGCNAWRTAHNPPNEALLDVCDRLGMMVMDENRHFGDTYASHSAMGTQLKDTGGFSDLATMIRRDRNHPCIVMWSLFNEEGQLQGTPQGAALFTNMMRIVHQYDTTRPITSAMNKGWLAANGVADVEDIIGVNYNTDKYDSIHARHPNKAMFGSEDTNEKTTRGQYADDRTNGMSSCYNLSNTNWLSVVNRPFMCGSFTWTGYDYRGEPNPYRWPDVSNNTGLMDLAGFPKDKYYYFESCWSDKPMVHLMPDGWNAAGNEGKTIRVIAFSNARQVELFLNGRSLGKKDVPHDDRAEWQVPYQPGKLEARAYTGRKMVATDAVETTDAPARIVLLPDYSTLHANGEDVVVVSASIVDKKGRVVPDSDNRVSFELAGGGRIVGVGNGNPADHDTDRAQQRRAFHGRCIVVVQAGTEPDGLKLIASSPGLESANVTIQVK